MKVVTLVPWRGGNTTREWNWKVTRPYLEALGYPMFLGDSPGPWARAAACNAAARAAGRWDVALIADADTIGEPEVIARAVTLAHEEDAAIRPHDRLYALTQAQSRILAKRGPDRVRLSAKPKTMPGGGLLVVSRRAWETVGGYDERFIGWGHEDSALHTSLLAHAHWDRIEGRAWHLYHPRDHTDTPERRQNRLMMVQLQQQHRRVIEAESERRGWDIGAVL